MSRFLLIGDIHLSSIAPSSCFESYCDDLFTILEHTIQLEIDLDVDAVIWAGDVFHLRQANRNPHSLVQRGIDIVQKYKNLWIVPGNHDLANGDRLESIFETQPLGVLLKSGAKLLKGWANDGSPLYGVPWEAEWSQKAVEAAFEDWNAGLETHAFDLSKCLAVAHAPLFPPSLEAPWEYYPTGESRPDENDKRAAWADIQEAGYCYYGHVHPKHGVYKVGDVTFCNNGAITRGSLHESELNRKIVVTTWSPEEGFIEVPVPHKPSSEVFKLMEKREEQDKKLELESFLSSVGSTELEVTSIESVIEYLKTIEADPAVISLAIDLIRNV